MFSLRLAAFLALASSSTCASSLAAPSFLQSLYRRYVSHEISVDYTKHDVEFFTFVTRPDIDAPRLEVKVYNESALSPGYFFISPYGIVDQTDHDKHYVGPHIYDHAGNLIWSGAPFFDGYDTFDFKISQVHGQDMLTAIVPHDNHSVILNDQYELYAAVDTGNNHETLNMHDFQIVDDGTRALYLTRNFKETSEENSVMVGYRGQCNVDFTGFEERDLDTNEVTFKWTPENRIDLNESAMYQNNVTWQCQWEPWDYLHMNSIEKLPDGDYLMSGRRSYALYKISHKDGSILWRFGGKKTDFEFDGHFSGQHDARCLFQNSTHMLISFLDNAIGPGFPVHTNDFSRGVLIWLDTEKMFAKQVQTFDHPHEDYARGRGNFQTLPNGNAFLSWMKEALQSEHTPDGSLVMEARFPCGLKTYRAYKFPWIGRPTELPAVHSQVVEVERELLLTAVHVSWNGDTEVTRWELHKTNADGSVAELVVAAARMEFETSLMYAGYAEYVMAVGFDRNGNKLAESRVVKTGGLGGNKMDPAVLKEVLWQQEHAPESISPGESHKTPEHDRIGSIFVNPIFTFFGGIAFSAAAVLTAWYVWWARRNGKFPWRSRRQLYAALPDNDEERDGATFRDEESKQPITPGPGD